MLDIALKVVTILSIVGGGSIVLIKLGKLMEAFNNLSLSVSAVQEEIKKLNEVMMRQAVQDEKLVAIQNQQGMLMRWYDELRRGQGLITSRPSDLQGGI